MEDELRKKIATELYRRYAMHCQYATDTWKDFIPAADSILALLAPILADAERWRRVMEVYHADTEERFVQFANTMSKVRELEGEGGPMKPFIPRSKHGTH